QPMAATRSGCSSIVVVPSACSMVTGVQSAAAASPAVSEPPAASELPEQAARDAVARVAATSAARVDARGMMSFQVGCCTGPQQAANPRCTDGHDGGACLGCTSHRGWSPGLL